MQDFFDSHSINSQLVGFPFASTATDGNVRKVQKLSRHTQLDTLMIYDDNRQKWQLEITDLLAEMV